MTQLPRRVRNRQQQVQRARARRKLSVESLEGRQLMTGGFELLLDLHTGDSVVGSNPGGVVSVNGVTYFTATGSTTGTELWRTDGTSVGTRLVKDIAPGPTSSSPSSLMNLNGILVFAANDGNRGTELWRSDGTESGTEMVYDINPGMASSNPGSFLVSGGAVLFAASDGVHGRELWGTNGTRDLTLMIKDINPGVGDSNPTSLFQTPFQINMSANDGTNGIELWRTTGSESGTTMISDINPGPASSNPANFTMVGSQMLFSATSAAAGNELWSNLITSVSLVKDILPGTGSSFPANFLNESGRLYFSANDGTNGDELWKSDLTTATTSLWSNIASGSSSSSPTGLTNVNGIVYFSASTASVGRELFKTSSVFGTSLVKDINTSFTGYPNSSFPSSLTNFNGTLYFSASNGSSGTELWKSNGSSAGTVQVHEINPTGSASISSLRLLDGLLWFSANDGTHGQELWKSDGVTPTMVKDIVGGTADAGVGFPVELNGNLLFSAIDASHGNELWKTDGTPAGTVLLKDLRNGTASSSPQDLTLVNSQVFFVTTEVSGNGLWTTDGTQEGTTLIRTFAGRPDSLTNFNGSLLFSADSLEGKGRELWKSDGTLAGTVMVKDIATGASSSNPGLFAEVSGTLYFQAGVSSSGAELWATDGTSAGTRMVKDIMAGATGSSPSSLTNSNGQLYFSAFDSFGIELWKSDGTSSGTVRVKDIAPGASASSIPQNLVNANGTLYFRAITPSEGMELWKSDGTSAGTILVKDILPGSGSGASQLVSIGSTVYLRANDGATGYELWKSDGTAAGTVLVHDIRTGSLGGWDNVFSMSAMNGRLFFTATDPDGTQFWTSDGTREGTKIAVPRTAGMESRIGLLASLSGKLILAGTSEAYGRELYVDRTAPQVVALAPELVDGVVAHGISTMSLQFSESVLAPSGAFSLFGTGADGLLGTLDDGVVSLTVTSTPGEEVEIGFPTLAQGVYRLRVAGTGNAITDIAGNRLDGDSNGAEGGDYVIDFVVDQPQVELDTAFDGDGKLLSPFNAEANESYAVVTQPDGKMVVVGGAVNGTDIDVAVARYLPDGSYDTTFGVNGRVLTAIGSGTDLGVSVSLQADGKIVVAGSTLQGANYESFVLRYGSDGALDLSFDGDGKVITSLGVASDIAVGVVALPSGKIVVGGYSSNGTDFDFAVVRYNPGGSIDTTFGDNGWVKTAVGSGNDIAAGMMVQPDGKIVLVGSSANGGGTDIGIVRYHADGSLDASFDGDGRSMIAIGSGDDAGYAAALQTDGKILIAGSSVQGSSLRIAGVRLNADGLLDTSFDGDGKLVVTVGSSAVAYGVVPQSDGKILLGGESIDGASSDFTLVRLLSDGSLDSSFDTDGRLVIAMSGGADAIRGLSMQAGTRIMAVGYADSEMHHEMALLRLRPERTSLALATANGISLHVDRDQFGVGSVTGGDGFMLGSGRLQIGGVDFATLAGDRGLLEDEGRTMATSVIPNGGLQVSRKVTVPSVGNEDLVRHLETLANPTSGAISTTVRVVSHLGAGGATEVFATSDGDLEVEPSDWWIGLDDDMAFGGARAKILVLRGPFVEGDTEVAVIGEQLAWSMDLTIPAGETRRIATFTVMGSTRSEAMDAVEVLLQTSGFGGEAGSFLGSGEIASLANMHFNSAPSDIVIHDASIVENGSVMEEVGVFSTVDGEVSWGDTHDYSLIEGDGDTDNGAFAIEGSRLLALTSFNYEVQSIYSIRMRSTDRAGLSTDRTFSISVSDENESPRIDLEVLVSELDENLSIPSPLQVANIVVTDDGLGDEVLSLTGSQADLFEIIGSGLYLRAGTDLDFESLSQYQVTVGVDDLSIGIGKEDTEVYALTILNLPETPTALTLTHDEVLENVGGDVEVGRFQSVDTPDSTTFTYALVSGAGDVDNGLFEIDGDRLLVPGALDFELQATRRIRVRTTNSAGLWYESEFSISIVDEPEGTSGNDLLVLTLSGVAPTGSVTVTRSVGSGVPVLVGVYPMDRGITVYGLGGTDGVKVVGTGGEDEFAWTESGFTGNGALIHLVGTESFVVQGGAGNDIYRFATHDTIGFVSLDESQGGVDTLDFSACTVGVTVNLALVGVQTIHPQLTLSLKSASTFERIVGGSGNDQLIGNSLANVLYGGDGDDILQGASGIDTLVGGLGNDTLQGGASNDWYLFDADLALGSDLLIDTSGVDTLSFEGTESDVVVDLSNTLVQSVNANLMLTLGGSILEGVLGGDGHDTLTGNSSANLLVGGVGNDLLSGGFGNDTYGFNASIGIGNDTIVESLGIDTLSFAGTSSAVSIGLGVTGLQVVNPNLGLTLVGVLENLIGGDGDDLLVGSSGNNVLTGGRGNDVLQGALGNDTYLFAADEDLGSDTISDGGGTDTISFGTTLSDLEVDLDMATDQTVNSHLALKLLVPTDIENLAGGLGNDRFWGNARNNTLAGGSGNDRLEGRGGSDFLQGGAGDDLLVGGSEDDVYVFDADTPLGTDTVDESGGGMDTLNMSKTVSRNATLSLGLATVQVINSNLQLQLLSGEEVENATGTSLADIIVGNGLSNTLVGGSGNDSLNGLEGDDVLVGEAGDDWLEGGVDHDRYVFDADNAMGLGVDTIQDVAGVDTFDFSLTTTLGVTLDLGLTAVQAINSRLSLQWSLETEIEGVLGTGQADWIQGNALANVLVGNGGNDQLAGGLDRDILIGGVGVDTIDGGDGEDIVIAGKTTSDGSAGGLRRIREEWISGSSISVRTANLRLGVGIPPASLKAKATVLKDAGAVDVLTGGGDDDWFFRSVDDAITDLAAGDLIDLL